MFLNVSFCLPFCSLSDKLAAHRCGCISGSTIFPVYTRTGVFHCHHFWGFFGSTEDRHLFLQSVGNFYCLVFLRFHLFVWLYIFGIYLVATIVPTITVPVNCSI